MKKILSILVVFLVFFSSNAQELSKVLLFEKGYKLEKVISSYEIDESTRIWHAMMDGNVLTAVLFTKGVSGKWSVEKLALSHYEVYSSNWIDYAKIDGEIVRFRTKKVKKEYGFFKEKLVNKAFEKSSTPFYTVPKEEGQPLIENVVLTEEVNIFIRNLNDEGNIEKVKILAFDKDELNLTSTRLIALESKAKDGNVYSYNYNNQIAISYFGEEKNFYISTLDDEHTSEFMYERNNEERIMYINHYTSTDGRLIIEFLENAIDAKMSILQMSQVGSGKLELISQSTLPWGDTFRDYGEKIEKENSILVNAMKRRYYALTNRITSGEDEYLVFVISVPIIGTSTNASTATFSKHVWGVDYSDLLVVKLNSEKNIEWMQSVRRAYREVNKLEESHVPTVIDEEGELIIISRESSQFFDDNGKYISGLDQSYIPELVDSKVFIDKTTGEVIKNIKE